SGTSTTKSESHKYTNTARNIIAKLTVTDALGLTATRNLAIHVVLGPCSTRFQTGDRVRVVNAGSDREHGLLVRLTPEATSNIGAHIDGELGTIVGSPQLARGYCRWNVNYDSDPDGWSAEGSSNPVQYWLEKVSDGTSRVTPPGVTPPGITPPGTPVPPVQPQPGPAGVTGTFSVTSPMAGETWRVGEIRSIKWTPPAGVSALDIYLGTGLIRIGAANVGQFDWVIPSSLNNQSIEGAGRQIVLNVPGGGQAASGQFSILSKQLGVGDTVQNIQTLNVKLSLNPDISGGVQYAYARGTIAQGPQLGPPQLLGGNKYWWVDYPTGADGWVLDDDLAKVVPLNLPPKIDRFEPNSPVFYVGIEDKLEVQATDPEGQTLNYKIDWGDGSSDNYTGASGQSVTISHAYTQAGPNKNISVTVSDGQLTDSKTLSVTVNQPSVVTNLPPNSLTITGPTSVTTGVVNTWQVKATDPEGLSLTYTVSWGDATSNSTYTGASGQSVNISHNYGQFGAATIQAGSKTITVKVSDGQLTDSKTLTVNVVTGSSSSQGPSSQISGPQTPVVGVPNSWQIVAYDPDSTSISFVVNWGDGISNNYSGPPGQQITATHTYSQPGQRTINVVASDGALTHGSSWGVSVLTPDRATQKPTLPIITGPTKVIVGTSNSWQVLIQDPDTNALSYTIDWGDGTSGSGNAQNGQTVTISHTYATVGFKTFMVIVSDGNSTESRTFSPTVVLDNQPPTISSLTGPVEIGTGVTGLWQITGSDPEAGALTYAVNWGGGGTNTYTGSSGQAVSGNHAYAQAGSFTIQVTATDNGGLTATKTFNTQTKVVTATAGSVKFKVNDSIEVMPDNSNLAMRALPKVGGYWIVGRNAVNRGGVRGVVVGGPVAADGYNWWEIKWNDNLIGWSAENWLQKYTASSGTQTSTIRVGQYAPLINHPDLPPKGNPQKLSTFSLNGRVWGWAAGDGLWKFTSGPDLTIQY
ncbi:MAG: hypothetical protein HY093_00855, partial [Candidatus Liptonbacteria bacterium]|nr:hypothetical protein [Candidatus Liptonbacteria bacterium]